MIERDATSRWITRASIVALSLLILALQIQPNFSGDNAKVLPDLVFAIMGAMALRRPDILPLALVGVVMFLADLLLMRPPGLYAFLSTIAAAWMILRHDAVRESRFLFEWLQFAIAFCAVIVSQHVILGLILLPTANILLELRLILWTVLCYPVVCVMLYLLLRVRRLVPGERDLMGQLR